MGKKSTEKIIRNSNKRYKKALKFHMEKKIDSRKEIYVKIKHREAFAQRCFIKKVFLEI